MKHIKHILACALVFVLMFASVSAVTAFAADEGTAVLSITSAEAEAGETVNLKLSLDQNPGMLVLGVSIRYDIDVFDIDEDGAYDGDEYMFPNLTIGRETSTGRYFAYAHNRKDVTDTGLLTTIPFIVAEDAAPGVYDITIQVKVGDCSNRALEDIPVETISGTITVKAPEPTTATVTTSATNGTVTGAGEYEIGAEATLTATPDTGYKFAGWYENGELVSENATFSFTVEANRELTATFAKETYTITVSTENGTATGAGNYEYGDNVTLTATANVGYKFVGWFNGETKVSEEAAYTFTVAADCAYTAKFEKIEYTVNVTVDPTEGGTVAGGATGEYEIGTNVILTATANNGYKFAGWYKDGELVEEEILYSFTVEADCEIVAKFEALVYYNVTVGATEGGNASGSNTVLAGNSVTVIATPDADYNFLGWFENGEIVSTETTYTFTPAADIELEARFEKKPAPVTGLETEVKSESGEPVTGVTVTTDEAGYEMGDTFKVTVNVNNAEYMFIGWYQGERFLSADLVYKDIYFEGIELTAKVVKKPENNGFAYMFGYTDTEMGAEGSLLRGEAAQIIYRLFSQAGNVTLGNGFDDMDGWFQNGLLYVSNKGLWNTSSSAYPYAVVSKGEVYKVICIGYGLTTDGSLSAVEYATILKNAGYIDAISADLGAAMLRWEFCEIVNKITGRDQNSLIIEGTTDEVTAEDYGYTDLSSEQSYYKTMLIAASKFTEEGYVDLNRGSRDELDKVKKDEE